MAGEGQQKAKVPKVFSDKAKAAGIAAQAALDTMAAKVEFSLKQRGIELNTRNKLLQFSAGKMDEARQMKAEREAQGQVEPVGPEFTPVAPPDPSQPSNSLQGATGLDLNALLTAGGAVNGGAGIQAATGGMGRAEGGGVDPNQLQGAVNPYNVSQSTVNRTVPVEYGGNPTNPYGGVINVPQTATETQVTPNQISPYQLGQLQNQLTIARNKAGATSIKGLIDDNSKSLAQAKSLRMAGMISEAEYNEIAQGVGDALVLGGLPQQALAFVDASSDAQLGDMKAEQFKSYPELQKEIAIIKTMKPGSAEYRATAGRINKLSTREESPFRDLARIQLLPAIRELNDNIQKTGNAVNQLNQVETLYNANPQLLGLVGKATRVTSEAAGVIGDVINKINPSRLSTHDIDSIGGWQGYQGILQDAQKNLDTMLVNTENDPMLTDDQKAEARQVYDANKTFLTNGTVLGTAEQLRVMLTVNLATSILDRATILGIEGIGNKLFNIESGSAESAKARMRALKLTKESDLNNLRATGAAYGDLWREPKFTYPNYLGGIIEPSGTPTARPGPRIWGTTQQPVPGLPTLK